MSRELKFRAWVYYGEKLDKPDYSRDYGCLDRFFEDHSENDCEQCIEQYTGLKDKNGEEIYEGDILIIPARKDKLKGYLYTVVWHKVHARFNFANKNGEFGEINIGKIKRAEVIGNIHENPELLGGEE